jgi:hypothetical protein
MSLLVFFARAAVRGHWPVRRETAGWKWPASIHYMTGFAYASSFIAFNLFT